MGGINVDFTETVELSSSGSVRASAGVPRHMLAQLRDTQRMRAGNREGHVELAESRVVPVANPLAGADVVAKVPQNGKWSVSALSAILTTSATVANRVPHLQITDGGAGHVVYDFPLGTNILAGLTTRLSAGTGVIAQSNDNSAVLVLPFDLDLLGGWTVGFSTTALQAGDQWSALAVLVEETLYY